MSGGDPLRPPVPIRRGAPPPLPVEFSDLRPSDHFVVGKRHAALSWQLIFHLAWALFFGAGTFLYRDLLHSNDLLSKRIGQVDTDRQKLGSEIQALKDKAQALENKQNEAIAAGKMIDVPGMQKEMRAIETQLTRLNTQFEDFTRDERHRER